jgi:shikimate kinase
MGSGKSTQGKKLATLLRMRFIDLDKHIQKEENKTIQNIFEIKGERAFRDLETKYIHELIQEKNDKIVSLGGGAVCFNNNIQLLKENGVLVYLQMPALALAERLLKSRQNRPLIKNVAPSDLPNFIESKLNERLQYYQQADITINGIDCKVEELNNQIVAFKKND